MTGAIGLSPRSSWARLAVSYWIGFAYRSTDVDDVILNVLGAALGYLAFLVLRPLLASAPTR